MMSKEELDEGFDLNEYEHIRTLILIHEHVSAAECDYYRSQGRSVFPPYILEKLNTAKMILDNEIRYWERKMNHE